MSLEHNASVREIECFRESGAMVITRVGLRIATIIVLLVWNLSGVAQSTDINSGYVRDGIYINRFLGLTLKPPTDLSFESDFRYTRSGGALVLARAIGKSQLALVKPVLVLAADELSYYPMEQRGVAPYLERLVEEQKEAGYTTLNAGYEFVLAGHKLVRADLRKGSLFQAVCLSIRKGFAVVLIVIGPNEQELNSMIQTIQLTFTD